MKANRVSEFHKGAFWIYGVTAMVMHDPLAHTLSHLSSAGLANWEVRLEIWRCAVLLVLMARFFLAAGLYFDQVYLRETSAGLYPSKSYPLDFLAGLMQFLLLAAAAVTAALHTRFRGEIATFTVLVLLTVLYENLWYLMAAVLGFSTRARIAAVRSFANLTFGCAAAVYLAARLAIGADPVFADQAAFGALSILGFYEIARLIRRYDAADAEEAAAGAGK